jgi:hypothetical protein
MITRAMLRFVMLAGYGFAFGIFVFLLMQH